MFFRRFKKDAATVSCGGFILGERHASDSTEFVSMLPPPFTMKKEQKKKKRYMQCAPRFEVGNKVHVIPHLAIRTTIFNFPFFD
jgi:hypothetical protein